MQKFAWKVPAALAGSFMALLLLAGCADSGGNTTPTPTPTVAATATVESQAAAAPAATVTPRATATPRPEPTVQPTVAPTPVPTVVDRSAEIQRIVSQVMDAAPSGSPEQLTSLKGEVELISTNVVDQLVQNGVGLDDDTVNEVVGAIVERAIHNGLFCWASNLGPENEIRGAGVQRRELSTGGIMHVDHYNDPSLPSASILVRAGEAAVVAGFGSQFEFPWDRCGQFDFVADATNYARDRRDWGHSGVVFNTLHDALHGDPIVNLWGLSASQINELRPVLWDENPANTTAVRAITGSQVDAREEACGAAQVVPHNPAHNQPWNVQGPAIVNFWSNWPELQTPQGQEYKLLVSEGQTVALRGGGTAWIWSEGCGDVAQDQYADNPLPVMDDKYISGTR